MCEGDTARKKASLLNKQGFWSYHVPGLVVSTEVMFFFGRPENRTDDQGSETTCNETEAFMRCDTQQIQTTQQLSLSSYIVPVKSLLTFSSPSTLSLECSKDRRFTDTPSTNISCTTLAALTLLFIICICSETSSCSCIQQTANVTKYPTSYSTVQSHSSLCLQSCWHLVFWLLADQVRL